VIYFCKHCEAHRNFRSLSVTEVRSDAFPEQFTFAACEACSYPAVYLREDYDLGAGFDDDEYYRVYPPHERAVSFALPGIVKESYEEAVRCEVHKSWIACVTMVGRTLEAVTKEYAPSEKSMFGGLKRMYDDGAISQEIHDWANELRAIRNIGAHATQQKLSRQDARESLDFLQAILETIYYMRPKFVAMKARRQTPSTSSLVVP
jgi:hypothetical protein